MSLNTQETQQLHQAMIDILRKQLASLSYGKLLLLKRHPHDYIHNLNSGLEPKRIYEEIEREWDIRSYDEKGE